MKTNPYYYLGANPTVDIVLLYQDSVLLIKRRENSPACPNQWALPGGFIDSTAKRGEKWIDGLETPAQACIRELEEETNININYNQIKFIGVFEGNNRDPRDNNISWSQSHAFLYSLTPEEFAKQTIIADSDASDYKWEKLEIAKLSKLAFDHNLIINSSLPLIYSNLKTKKEKP